MAALVTMGGLFVKALVSDKASLAQRYEAELQRQREEHKEERAQLIAERDYWRDKATSRAGP